MEIYDFLGTTLKAIEISGSTSSKLPVSSAFFKPYQSLTNVVGRTTSIITDPVVLAGLTAYCTLQMGIYLLKSIVNLITINLSDAKENISAIGTFLLAAALAITALILSPLVNFIDLIGGAVVSLIPNDNDTDLPDYISLT